MVSIGNWMVQSFQWLNHNINKMKKLSLEMLRLTSADVLERSQMKKITGGYGSCYLQCDSWNNFRPMAVDNCHSSILSLYCTGGGVCTC
jgi:natural product precursor